MKAYQVVIKPWAREPFSIYEWVSDKIYTDYDKALKDMDREANHLKNDEGLFVMPTYVLDTEPAYLIREDGVESMMFIENRRI